MQYTSVLNLRTKTHAWISNIEYHSCVFPVYCTECLLYVFKFITSKMNWLNLFSQNATIYVSFLTHMTVFPYETFLLGNLLDFCRLLRLMQTIHTSAVSCCFCRIECHFSHNCCYNVFLFVAWHITHLQFHFS